MSRPHPISQVSWIAACMSAPARMQKTLLSRHRRHGGRAVPAEVSRGTQAGERVPRGR
jgi:hypothetical protein